MFDVTQAHIKLLRIYRGEISAIATASDLDRSVFLLECAAHGGEQEGGRGDYIKGKGGGRVFVWF